MSLIGALAFAYPVSATLGERGANAEETSALPACEAAVVEMVDSVDSARAIAGDSFRVATLADVPATLEHAAVPQGTTGYGMVMGAHHAGRNGRPGHLDVELRFLELADGRLPVSLVPRRGGDVPVSDGLAVNAPGFLGIIPFGGVMVGAYNTVHYGREVVLAAGSHVPILIGDDLARGTCRIAPEGTAKH